MTPRVVVVGSFNVDHAWTSATLPRTGETLAGTYSSGPGGKGFNQATAAARAGADTTLVCALGDDAGGRWAQALAAVDGIVLRVEHCAAPTGTAGIFVDARGRNCIVLGPGANAMLSAAHVARQGDALEAADVVLAQLEAPADAVVAALEAAHATGATTVLNPAPSNVDTPRRLLACTDILTPNETEFAALAARHADVRIDPDAVAAGDQAGLHVLCRQLLPHGTVVVTLGAAGCFVSHADGAWRGDTQGHYRVAAEVVQARDTTGAGDAFNGALAASLAAAGRACFGDHVRFASRYAGLSTERAGAAAAMPAAADVAARFGA